MYPIYRYDDRKLDNDYSGIVITCDVDKTYLDTDFKSIKGLLTIPFEWAEDKQTVAGMAPVLKELRFGSGNFNALIPFYFLTASPPFLIRILKKKMLIDSVQYDGIISKDWSKVIFKHKKTRWLKHQIGYKLCALLTQRIILPKSAKEILIGDDVEVDAFIYSFYADLLSGKIKGKEIGKILSREKCDEEEISEVIKIYDKLNFKNRAVHKIYIYMDKGENPSIFNDYGKDLIACLSPFQMAIHLYFDKQVRLIAVKMAAKDLLKRKKATFESLLYELREGVNRGIYNKTNTQSLYKQLVLDNIISSNKSLF